MAFGNKFVKTQGKKAHPPRRAVVKPPEGPTYTIDPFTDPAVLKPWETTAAIKHFMDMHEGFQKQAPNRFVRVQQRA